MLFHTWNNDTYRIFEILGEPVMEKTIVNIPSTNSASTYMILDLDMINDPNVPRLNVKGIEHDGSTRYDTRFAKLSNLEIIDRI